MSNAYTDRFLKDPTPPEIDPDQPLDPPVDKSVDDVEKEKED